jgi:peptidoglycan/xylan/chitin deacetylase (PgdA/CDA1 family)
VVFRGRGARAKTSTATFKSEDWPHGIYNRSTMLGPLIGAGVAALVGATAYQSMAPWAQGFGATFVSGRRGSKQIALTYDDGPNDPHTLRLMEVLAKRGVCATFFVIGRYVERRPDIVRDLLKAGHVLGNHTFTHPHLIVSSPVETRNQLEECQRALQEAGGESLRLFRPPFGGRRPTTLGIARSLGMEPIMWNVTSWDWQMPPAAKIVETCTRQMRGGDVILMHDGSHIAPGADRAQTVVATDLLIERWTGKGYEFVTVPEMMAGAGVRPQPSVVG